MCHWQDDPETLRVPDPVIIYIIYITGYTLEWNHFSGRGGATQRSPDPLN